jgi:hypothetical protein
MHNQTDPEIHIPLDQPMEDLRRTDHAAFTSEVKALVREAEALRLRYMKSRQKRGFMTLTIALLSVLAGGAGFGWYFLVVGDLAQALTCVGLSVLPYFLLSPWANAPLNTYARLHKSQFMPKLAHVLGGFHYRPSGGVSEKVLGPTAILPAYTKYTTEDCFIGVYKGIKVIFSEAKLRKGPRVVFEGIFVLLELPKPIFKGNLILTANKKMADDRAATRWKNLENIPAMASNPEWNRFLAFSDNPPEAKNIITDKFLKELSEAADVFGRALISASFLKGRYIFIAIPSGEDMFEASDIQVPITTTSHLEARRREIAKLLEVIDVFEIYIPKSGPVA